MITTLQLSVGGGRATLNLDVSKGSAPASRRRLGLLLLLLVMPVVLVIGGQAIGSLTGWYSLDRVMNAPSAPWVYLLTAATFGVLLAVCVVLVTRLRLVIGRQDRSRQLTVTLSLTALEALSLLIAAGLLTLFAVHLLADGLACARGVRSAC